MERFSVVPCCAMRTTFAALLLCAVVARAEDTLDDLVLALRIAPADGADTVIKGIMALDAKRADVLASLRTARGVPATKAGWQSLQATDENGVTRPFEIYIPQSVVGKTEPVPLLVHMHGGVSRAAYPANPGQGSSGVLWVPSAEEQGFVIVAPAGRAGSVW